MLIYTSSNMLCYTKYSHHAYSLLFMQAPPKATLGYRRRDEVYCPPEQTKKKQDTKKWNVCELLVNQPLALLSGEQMSNAYANGAGSSSKTTSWARAQTMA
jgi:hypothetical protein